MKKLLSISYSLTVLFLLVTSHVNNASAQKTEDASRRTKDSIVAKRGSSVDLGGLASYSDASILNFSSTDLRQISGRYSTEGSNEHLRAMRQFWDKLNARNETLRDRY